MEKGKIKGAFVKVIALVIVLFSALMLFSGCQLVDKDKTSLTNVNIKNIEYVEGEGKSNVTLSLDFDNSTIWNVNGFNAKVIFKDKVGNLVETQLTEKDVVGEFFVRHGRMATFEVKCAILGNVEGISAYNINSVEMESYWQTYKVWYLSIFAFFGVVIILYSLYVFIKRAEFGEIFSLLDDYGVFGTITVVLLLAPLVLLIFLEWINFISIMLAIIVTFVICWFTHYVLVFCEFLRDYSLNKRDKKLLEDKQEEGLKEGEKESQSADEKGKSE